MAATVQSEVPMVGSVAKMVNRLSKVEDPNLKISEPKKQLHIVIFEYKAQQTDELEMEVNDIIEIIKPVEDGWNRGKNERTGKTGMYPTNYCEVYRSIGGVNLSGINKQYISLKKTEGSTSTGEVPAAIKRISGMEVFTRVKEESPMPSMNNAIPSISSSPPILSKEESEKEFARVTFDYESQHEDEISLKVGQIVWVTNKRTTDSGWYEGEVDGRRGLFPDNFVTLMRRDNGVGASNWTSNDQSCHHSPILPPSSISSSSLSNTPSGRINDKPPASLPGAISVMPLPPQVPAKPPKSVGGISNGMNTTTSIGNGAGWKMNNSGHTVTPSTTYTSTTSLPTPSTNIVVKEEVKEKEKEKEVIKPSPSSFKDKQANILASLNISSLNPSIPRPAPSSLSKSTTRIDQEGVSNENGELLSKETPLLSHPTKNRPKVPSGVRRPVSMFPPPSSHFASSTSKDGMSRSEVLFSDQPAPIGSSTSLSPSALSITPSLPSKPKETQPAIVSSSRSSASSTPTPTPLLPVNHTTLPDVSHEMNQSQWVSRSEYNQLLSKVNQLEERLAAMERL